MQYFNCSYKFNKSIMDLTDSDSDSSLIKVVKALNMRIDKELSAVYNIGNYLLSNKSKRKQIKERTLNKEYFYWFIYEVDNNEIKCAVAINRVDTEVSYAEAINIILERFTSRKVSLYTVEKISAIQYKNCIKKSQLNKISTNSDELNSLEIYIDNSESLDILDANDEIEELIGLDDIKKKIKNIVIENRINKLRKEKFNLVPVKSINMCFYGNPGTCKTTIARLVAKLFKQEKILSKGKFIEVSRADLVEKYVGWTAKNVKDKVKEAQGGVLFIDEAYSICHDYNDSFGSEALDTLVKEIEDNRNNMLVIFAGYPKKMQEFLSLNEGINSRISYHIYFDNYSLKDLEKILVFMASKYSCRPQKEFLNKSNKLFKEALTYNNFSNGRFVRNLLERALTKQAIRIDKLIKEGANDKKITKELQTLRKEDLDEEVLREFIALENYEWKLERN